MLLLTGVIDDLARSGWKRVSGRSSVLGVRPRRILRPPHPLPKKIMGHEFFLSADLIEIRSFNHIYLITNMFHGGTVTLSFSVFAMNYIQTTPSRQSRGPQRRRAPSKPRLTISSPISPAPSFTSIREYRLVTSCETYYLFVMMLHT